MVGEFPELQGLMGCYYAPRAWRGSRLWATAIGEHYRPQGQSDFIPTAPVSVAVALADKLDTLVGFFAIDEKPTGSKDPYALRRAALGIIRIILENHLRLPLVIFFFFFFLKKKKKKKKKKRGGGGGGEKKKGGGGGGGGGGG